jgi:hypothetical protein
MKWLWWLIRYPRCCAKLIHLQWKLMHVWAYPIPGMPAPEIDRLLRLHYEKDYLEIRRRFGVKENA